MRFLFFGFLSVATAFLTLPHTPLLHSPRRRHTIFKAVDVGEVLNEISEHHFETIVFDNTFQDIVLSDKSGSQRHMASHPVLSSKILDAAIQYHIPIAIQQDSHIILDIATKCLQAFVILSFTLLVLNLFRSVFQQNTMLPFPASPSSQKVQSNVTFADWCGSPEVLRECTEVVSFMTNKTNFEYFGARIPKGILLEGPPGTGKTLLAKAIAGEADVNFMSLSGSEFVELFVGMGASRVRKLFAEARRKSPCILFIDEIDAVGRQRGTGVNLGNDEREQTLNQLLAEMDGFQSNENILVIAATNRQDILDAALLRPGRFDRIIKVPLPDTQSRFKILEQYAKNKPLDESVDLYKVAISTGGFSGAQLENLLNEAALLSVRRNLTSITYPTLLDAKEKLLIGVQKETDMRTLDTKRRVAVHEAGHALVCVLYKEYFDFVKVTIQDTYSGAGGYTVFDDKLEISEYGLYTRDYLKKRLRILLAGRAAESVFYGDEFVSVGATEDLRQVNILARRMINQFGMGEQIENYHDAYTNDDNPFLGRTMGAGHHVSDELASSVDKEVLLLVKDAYQETKKVLKERETVLRTITDGLLINHTLYEDDIRELIN